MDTSVLLSLLMHGNQLKRTVRTGWSQRGIVDAENVAAHSYGVAFIALALAGVIPEPLNLQTVLSMAVLHDLPESLTTDIPSPAWRLLAPGAKSEVERSVMEMILGDVPAGQKLLNHWEELYENETAEARLVHDCDKLDMYLQAFLYERQTGNRHLGEFWEQAYGFQFAETRALYDELVSLRQKE